MQSFEAAFAQNNRARLRLALEDARQSLSYLSTYSDQFQTSEERELKELIEKLEKSCRLELKLDAWDINILEMDAWDWEKRGMDALEAWEANCIEARLDGRLYGLL